MDYNLNLALGLLIKQLTNWHYDYGIWMAFPYPVGRSKPTVPNGIGIISSSMWWMSGARTRQNKLIGV